VRRVRVPRNNPTLSFRALWDTEEAWDFGFVQVWNRARGRYSSVACTDTTSAHDSEADPSVQANLPGFTGISDGWQDQSCDLSAHAGQRVDVAFRYITDGSVGEAGFWVDDVAVGATVLSNGPSLAGWQSGTAAHPDPVNGFTLQLLAYRGDDSAAWLGRVPVRRGAGGDFRATVSRRDLHRMLGRSARTVAAVVMQDDPTETVAQYAHYRLRVNGKVQPGGGRIG
jgi:hypothetical protein